MRLSAYLARLKTNELDQLRDGLDNAIYWCGIEPVLRFLSTLGQREEEVQAVVSEMVDRAKEVD